MIKMVGYLTGLYSRRRTSATMTIFSAKQCIAGVPVMVSTDVTGLGGCTNVHARIVVPYMDRA